MFVSYCLKQFWVLRKAVMSVLLASMEVWQGKAKAAVDSTHYQHQPKDFGALSGEFVESKTGVRALPLSKFRPRSPVEGSNDEVGCYDQLFLTQIRLGFPSLGYQTPERCRD